MSELELKTDIDHIGAVKVQSVDALPVADVSQKRKVVFLTTDSKLYVCDGSSWLDFLDMDNMSQGSTNKFVTANQRAGLDNAPTPITGANPVASVADVIAGATAVLITNTTYYLADTGDDVTGDGSVGNPWFTINKVFDELSNKVIANGITVTISMAAGTYNYTTVQSINHPQSAQISITGNGIGSTIINSSEAGSPAVSVSKNNFAVLSGMTIQSSTATSVLSVNRARASLTNIAIDGGSSIIGIDVAWDAFILSSGTFTISNCTKGLNIFEHGSAQITSAMTVDQCTDGIYLDQRSSISIEGTLTSTNCTYTIRAFSSSHAVTAGITATDVGTSCIYLVNDSSLITGSSILIGQHVTPASGGAISIYLVKSLLQCGGDISIFQPSSRAISTDRSTIHGVSLNIDIPNSVGTIGIDAIKTTLTFTLAWLGNISLSYTAGEKGMQLRDCDVRIKGSTTHIEDYGQVAIEAYCTKWHSDAVDIDPNGSAQWGALFYYGCNINTDADFIVEATTTTHSVLLSGNCIMKVNGLDLNGGNGDGIVIEYSSTFTVISSCRIDNFGAGTGILARYNSNSLTNASAIYSGNLDNADPNFASGNSPTFGNNASYNHQR